MSTSPQTTLSQYYAEAAEGFAHEDWNSRSDSKFVLGASIVPSTDGTPPSLVTSVYEWGTEHAYADLTLEDVISLRAFCDRFITEASL